MKKRLVHYRFLLCAVVLCGLLAVSPLPRIEVRAFGSEGVGQQQTGLRLQPGAALQVDNCPGNIVVNGGFTNGLAPWTVAYGTPDLSTGPGYLDPGAVGMWGNQNPTIGEGLQQALTTVTGKTYIGSVAFQRVNDPGKLPYAMLKLRTSTTPLSSVAGGNTIFLSPSVNDLSWHPYSFSFMAPGPVTYLTINVENNSSANDGGQTSYARVDDICIREEGAPDFKATTVCQGQPTVFTISASGSTSWNWDFGDGTNSNQQNPTHTYANAGTYTVKLCVNGTTNCVTKTVTVLSAPPAPVITGPNDSCGLPVATYSVPATGGVAYSWAVNGGVIQGSSTTNSVNVVWNPSGTGTITVTVTSKGQCPSSATMTVRNCDLYQGECCVKDKFQVDLKSLSYVGNGVYNFTPALTTSMPNIIRVTANIISASVTYSPTKCGTGGPANAYVVGASNVSPFVASLPIANDHEAIWHGFAPAVSGVSFPMQLHFPLPPTGLCTDSLIFCMKFTVRDRNCKTCEIIQCFGPFKRGGGIQPNDTSNPPN